MPSSCAPSTASRRTLAPVATSACPYSSSLLSDSLAVLPAGSSFITLVRVRTSTSPGTARANDERSTLPRRYSFEHGGRSYGGAPPPPPRPQLPPQPPPRRPAAPP